MRFVRQMWQKVTQAIVELERHVSRHPDATHARSLLSDIATHHWQITREFIVTGRRCDWDPKNVELKAMIQTVFGTPLTTKQSLESCFNNIKDLSRQSKAFKMSSYTRFSYASLNPYAQSGGVNILKLEPEDFSYAAPDFTGTLKEVSELKMFSGVRSAELPDETPSTSALQNKWRPAGFMANRAASAAVATAIRAWLFDFSEDYLNKSWTGALFKKRTVYYRRNQEQYFIQCGFYKWASIVIPCQKLEDADSGTTYVYPTREELNAVTWLVADGVGKHSNFEYVPTEIQPPCCIPTKFSDKCCLAKITGPHEPILKPAFRAMVSFNWFCLMNNSNENISSLDYLT